LNNLSRPTYRNISRREVAPFDSSTQVKNRQRRKDAEYFGRAMAPHLRQGQPLGPSSFNAPEFVAATAVASIRKAFMLAKTSHRAWSHGTRYGRPDARRMVPAMRGQQDIFKYKTGRSTTMTRVYVVLDDSGSMFSQDARLPIPGYEGEIARVTRKMAAAVFGCTVATALGSVPTVALDVWHHSSGSADVELKWRWSRGTPMGVFNEAAIDRHGGGGNADGHALMALAMRMKSTLKPDERGIVLMVSDGLPADYAPGGTSDAQQALKDAVREVRAMGIEVIAVAIEGSDQSAYYGDGTIPFTGDWTALGRSLAEHIGHALAAGRR
jgi:cobalamin biosynthesis protein CobT